ncbi:MAG: hypothetical protein GY700_01590 [Propionibacteriaceae bacterium]|nr:hypothetical protein [Propionibacteriaceae bacterium]
MIDQGFKATIVDLASGQETEIAIPATDLGPIQVGDGMLSPDGSTLVFVALYGGRGPESFALIQVDLTTGTQREILAPQPTYYKVARFEADGSLLLTVAWLGEGMGTLRLHPDGTLEHLSDSTFLGVAQ